MQYWELVVPEQVCDVVCGSHGAHGGNDALGGDGTGHDERASHHAWTLRPAHPERSFKSTMSFSARPKFFSSFPSATTMKKRTTRTTTE